MSIIKRVTHPASLSFVNLILALGSVPTVALFSSTRKSRIMIPVGICSCQCTIIPERVFNLGGITDQFVRNKWSTSPVSVVFQNGIFIIRADNSDVVDCVHTDLHFNGFLQIWKTAEFY